MQDFRGKVAVVTGAASGIGWALAEQCAAEGMRVVLADVEAAALQQAADRLSSRGTEVLAVPTDVANPQAVNALAQATLDRFGAVHLLFNNAGVGGGSTIWESTLADWDWVMGVNFYGVVHGLRSFVPLMLRQDAEAHIVNTASIYGLTNGPGSGIYKASKHAVVAISETLYHELAQRTQRVRVSVLCPGFVSTRIQEAERNRPAELRNAPGTRRPRTAEEQAWGQLLNQRITGGTPPVTIAARVFDAIRADRFYILPNPEWKSAVRKRIQRIIEDGAPASLIDDMPERQE